MTSSLDSPVTRRLDELGIGYTPIAIPLDSERKPIRSLEESIAAHGGDPTCIVRSLVFRTGSGGFVLLAIAGGRADWVALRKHLGERRLALAEPHEVLDATGFPIGAVPPLALPESIRVLVDEGVFAHKRAVIGSGVLGYALELTGADLRLALKEAEVGKFTKPDSK
ncbi:MAG: aminoacyl-tRNA deacylase [Methylohalobius sp.]